MYPTVVVNGKTIYRGSDVVLHVDCSNVNGYAGVLPGAVFAAVVRECGGVNNEYYSLDKLLEKVEKLSEVLPREEVERVLLNTPSKNLCNAVMKLIADYAAMNCLGPKYIQNAKRIATAVLNCGMGISESSIDLNAKIVACTEKLKSLGINHDIKQYLKYTHNIPLIAAYIYVKSGKPMSEAEKIFGVTAQSLRALRRKIDYQVQNPSSNTSAASPELSEYKA